MGCGCQGTTWTPPTADQVKQADAAVQQAVKPILRGRLAPNYTWNGPQPAGQ